MSLLKHVLSPGVSFEAAIIHASILELVNQIVDTFWDRVSDLAQFYLSILVLSSFLVCVKESGS